jgi:hypothetical protein
LIGKTKNKDTSHNPPEYTTTEMVFTIVFHPCKEKKIMRAIAVWTMENSSIRAYTRPQSIENESVLIPLGNKTFHLSPDMHDVVPAKFLLEIMRLICEKGYDETYQKARVLSSLSSRLQGLIL